MYSPVKAAHSSFKEGSHSTKNTPSGANPRGKHLKGAPLAEAVSLVTNNKQEAVFLVVCDPSMNEL
jgi:hypothetical protein